MKTKLTKICASFLIALVAVFSLNVQYASAVTCGFGSEIAGGQCRGYLTTTGANTWTVPSDWSSTNTIETIGGGASGAAVDRVDSAGGGGGGAYSKITNLTLTPSSSVDYTVGIGGAAVAAHTAQLDGNSGGDTWFNGATLAASSVGAKGGTKGTHGAIGTGGGAGGLAADGVGTTKNSGGNGAPSISPPFVAGGGGGAAGPNGNGNNAPTDGTSNGGSGDNGSGGSAGSGNPGAGGAAGNGGNGTEWDASHGSGGGGGGSGYTESSSPTGGSGGNYGAGGGSADAGGNIGATSGAGIQGIIVITYTPAVTSSCTYSGSGNWNVKYSDNCYITTTMYVVGACNFIYDSAGSFGLSSAGSVSCNDINGTANFRIQGVPGSKIYAR